MTSNEIRASFLTYFGQRDHRIVASSPLVPYEDPTLLFVNAGMNQFKDVFLGRAHRDYRRATTSQKCMRVSGKHNDLDNVGPSFRHHTFFEMLGNFSFGDYFKKDAVRFAWELLTDVWNMPPERLVVSIFRGEHGIPRDEEAYDLWRQYVPEARILELGADDNFWQMGDTGPCGRCSEIYYVRGAGQDPGIEIWNNVFMEFERSADGTLTPLPAPSIDTGMGLERIAAVLQGTTSNYDTDLFTALLANIAKRTDGRTYTASMSPTDVSMRVVADHMRAMTFLIADGVIPSNEWRGYVLRKIMRRAMRHGRHLGVTEPFLHELVAVLARDMGEAYPELRTHQTTIETTVLAEENRFDAVLNEGLPRLEAEIERALASPARALPGVAAFKLYDTFGLPYDFIEDTAATRDVTVDREAFDRAMGSQREQARAKSRFKAPDQHAWDVPDRALDELRATGDQFRGYETTEVLDATILLVYTDGGSDPTPANALNAGEQGYLALSASPFYLESGGQVSDTGTITSATAGAIVEDVVRLPGTSGLPRLHRVRVTEGSLHERDIVTASVNVATRDATRRNHTATHLLHAALRQVLGAHVKQAGSLVAPDRLRFDFVHVAPVSRDEQAEIERIVNTQIIRNTPVQTDERPTEEAIAAGAMALFDEKYGDRVRVVSVPGFSTELCGGTHCRATGDIGLFTIVSEGGVAAGVRRIEAVTGEAAVARYQADRAALQHVLAALNVPADRAAEAVERLQSDVKRVTKEAAKAKIEGGRPAWIPTNILGVTILSRDFGEADKNVLRAAMDKVRQEGANRTIAVLTGLADKKVSILVYVSKDLTSRVHAGRIAKQLASIVGGSGGGRPDFAEAGGKDSDKAKEVHEQATKLVDEMLQAVGGQP